MTATEDMTHMEILAKLVTARGKLRKARKQLREYEPKYRSAYRAVAKFADEVNAYKTALAERLGQS